MVLNALSDIVKKRLGDPVRYIYGATEPERVDVYRAQTKHAPVFVFVHGGAWKTSDAQRNAFAAEMFVDAGIHYVLLEFTGIDQADGRLQTLVSQVSAGLRWVCENCDRFGGDATRVFVGAHSSGAHLTAAVLANRFADGTMKNPIKGALLCSGMYELGPVRLSKRSSYVRFDDAVVEELSALRHLDKLSMPIVLAYGTEETPEFQRQTRAFYDALSVAGKDVELIVAEGYNHFDIVESLGNPYGLLGRAALSLVAGVTPGRPRKS